MLSRCPSRRGQEDAYYRWQSGPCAPSRSAHGFGDRDADFGRRVMQEKLIEIGKKYLANTYTRFPIVITKGEGCWLWDMDGRRYLDFLSGIAVCNLGHAPRSVVEALTNQANRLFHVSNLFHTEVQIRASQLLVEYSFADKVFFCNSGAEANEAAIKLARRYSWKKYGNGRHEIIVMENSFHGRTMATLSAT